ncbi:MAG: hypothetical protein WA056_02315 [Gallionella sp.]
MKTISALLLSLLLSGNVLANTVTFHVSPKIHEPSTLIAIQSEPEPFNPKWLLPFILGGVVGGVLWVWKGERK